MYTVLLVIHVLVTIALIGVILIQRTSGDGLLQGGGNQFMSGRASANLMTRMTAILATAFIGLSLILGIVGHSGRSQSIAEKIAAEPAVEATPEVPKPGVAAPEVPKPGLEKKPAEEKPATEKKPAKPAITDSTPSEEPKSE